MDQGSVEGRPHVISLSAISLDGRLDGFPIDLEHYYAIAARFEVEAVLSGSETVVIGLERYSGVENQYDEGPVPERPRSGDTRPLFVIVDGRGRVRAWSVFQQFPYWRGGVALLSESVPEAHRAYLESRNVDTIVIGRDRVDLYRALCHLRKEFDVRQVRVDSGGRLNAALLRAGLIDEVHVLVCPYIVGGQGPRFFSDGAPVLEGADQPRLERTGVEPADDGTVLLSYRVERLGTNR
ncbi:hypothetical protein DSECCO2_193710 [anaerobic digester metagenome]